MDMYTTTTPRTMHTHTHTSTLFYRTITTTTCIITIDHQTVLPFHTRQDHLDL
jgi:hypothetical protein